MASIITGPSSTIVGQLSKVFCLECGKKASYGSMGLCYFECPNTPECSKANKVYAAPIIELQEVSINVDSINKEVKVK